MKNLLLATALTTISTVIMATPVYHPAGPNLTYGAISNGQTIMSDITNPAAGASIFTKDTGQFRFGILSSIGAGYEIGDVADLVNEIDATIDAYTNGITEQSLTDLNPLLADPIANFADANAYADAVIAATNQVISDTNTLLNAVQQDGYFKGFFSGHLPSMPLVITSKSLTGSFVLDINGSAVGVAKFLADPLDPLTLADVQAQANATFGAPGSTLVLGDLLSSDTTIIVKGAAVAELSLGYSTSFYESADGQLFGGFRGNYYQVGLTRTAQRIDASANQTLNDVFDNNRDEGYKDSSGFGIDLGVLWVATNYRAGATLKNVNKPSFDYNTIDTTGYTDPLILAELQRGDSFEMKPQLKLEGAMFTQSQNWVLGVGIDANATDDPVGDEYQWATVSAAYATDSWLIPGFRVGYRTNLAGTELSYLTLGATLFKTFNLDIAYGLDEINLEANDLTTNEGTVPRSIIVNLGFELTF